MMKPIYIPVLRLRQEEKKVLTTFDFGDRIYPYVEIFKEYERNPAKPRIGKTPGPQKPFHERHLSTLARINSTKLFVDLPVHLKQNSRMKKEVLQFLRKVVANRSQRTKYLLSLADLSEKLIPVISTYSQVTGEPNTIRLQEGDLRKVYSQLAFRTSETTFANDFRQITKVARPGDFLFLDIGEHQLVKSEDFEIYEGIFEELSTFDKCHIVLLGSAIPASIQNVDLLHNQLITEADNSLIENFKGYSVDCFADYAGIKKDGVLAGGTVSPGFIFYDAVDNHYYGFKGPEGREKKELEDFETIIVPDVLGSVAATQMKDHPLDYLSDENKGWSILNNIALEIESGKSQAKFKRISMEHYLHCIKMKINNGYFD